MADPQTLWPRLTAVIRDCFDDDSLIVSPQTTAKDVEGWDSVAHVQLMVAIEKEFRIRFTTGEMAGLKNVGELVATIGRKCAP